MGKIIDKWLQLTQIDNQTGVVSPILIDVNAITSVVESSYRSGTRLITFSIGSENCSTAFVMETAEDIIAMIRAIREPKNALVAVWVYDEQDDEDVLLGHVLVADKYVDNCHSLIDSKWQRYLCYTGQNIPNFIEHLVKDTPEIFSVATEEDIRKITL